MGGRRSGAGCQWELVFAGVVGALKTATVTGRWTAIVSAGKHNAQWPQPVWPEAGCAVAFWAVELSASVAEATMWQGILAALTEWLAGNGMSITGGMAHAAPAAMRASNTVSNIKRIQTMAA